MSKLHLLLYGINEGEYTRRQRRKEKKPSTPTNEVSRDEQLDAHTLSFDRRPKEIRDYLTVGNQTRTSQACSLRCCMRPL